MLAQGLDHISAQRKLSKNDQDNFRECILTAVHCTNITFFPFHDLISGLFSAPGRATQMVETNWGGGQSLYVLWKSHTSSGVAGAVGTA